MLNLTVKSFEQSAVYFFLYLLAVAEEFAARFCCPSLANNWRNDDEFEDILVALFTRRYPLEKTAKPLS